MYFDKHPDILRWSSEEIVINYRSPFDGRVHRYFPDAWVEVLDPSTGEISRKIIEVKPYKETIPPPRTKNGLVPKRSTRAAIVFATNKAKWDAATKYCDSKGWKFEILTEREILGR